MDGAIALRVLASGSSGNCSVVAHGRAEGRSLALIDLGLGPRKTRGLLRAQGLELDALSDVFITHVDSDHCHPNWGRKLPGHVAVHAHPRHAVSLRRMGLAADQVHEWRGEFTSAGGLRCLPALFTHDEAGVSVFRFESRGSLGFATDVGRATPELIEHLAGVETLAIESNYCPKMQRASARPAFLKQRITGGSGHLSNEECVQAARAIEPRRHVVLLHLSRQCNHPALASALHRDAWYELTLSNQFEATRWVVADGTAPPAPVRMDAAPPAVQFSLFATSPAV